MTKQTTINALTYVKNTNGGATKAHFIEDHEPIGPMLLQDLNGLVFEDENNRLRLTDEGKRALGLPL